MPRSSEGKPVKPRPQDGSLPELEGNVIQTAITAYCKPDDREAQDERDIAISTLIEARYQSTKCHSPIWNKPKK